jgi:hypothetical protein
LFCHLDFLSVFLRTLTAFLLQFVLLLRLSSQLIFSSLFYFFGDPFSLSFPALSSFCQTFLHYLISSVFAPLFS